MGEGKFLYDRANERMHAYLGRDGKTYKLFDTAHHIITDGGSEDKYPLTVVITIDGEVKMNMQTTSDYITEASKEHPIDFAHVDAEGNVELKGPIN